MRNPPNQIIAIDVKFMMSIIKGISNAISLLTFMAVVVNSLFASLNRFFS